MGRKTAAIIISGMDSRLLTLSVLPWFLRAVVRPRPGQRRGCIRPNARERNPCLQAHGDCEVSHHPTWLESLPPPSSERCNKSWVGLVRSPAPGLPKAPRRKEKSWPTIVLCPTACGRAGRGKSRVWKSPRALARANWPANSGLSGQRSPCRPGSQSSRLLWPQVAPARLPKRGPQVGIRNLPCGAGARRSK